MASPVSDPSLKSKLPASVIVGNTDSLIGTNLNGYVVSRLIAAGGMGLVYEATHETIGRRAAVKVLKPEVATDESWVKRFVTEARALAALKHRNLIEIINFGKTPDAREYLMMEFLEGEPLDAYMRRYGALPPTVALGIADQILNGLAEAHKKGVVHRDLKPSNIFLLHEHSGELLVKILDFGLARQEPIAMIDSVLPLPRSTDGASLLAGTPEYIAPEQARGLKAEGSADLYSLGAIGFEMLTGSLPFQDTNVTRLLEKQLLEPPPKLSLWVSDLPDGIEDFVMSLLAKEVSERPKSADVARATAHSLLKRLTQDSTALRMNPYRSPIPLKDVPQSDPDRSKTQELFPVKGDVDTSDQTTTPLELPSPRHHKRRRALATLLVLALILGLGTILISVMQPSGSNESALGQVDVVVKDVTEATQLAPDVAKVDPPPQPTGAPDAEELAPLPTAIDAPKKPLAPVVAAQKSANRPSEIDCTPDDEWRAGLRQSLAEIGMKVADQSAKYKIFEQAEVDISRSLMKAQTPTDCSNVNASFESLRSKLIP